MVTNGCRYKLTLVYSNIVTCSYAVIKICSEGCCDHKTDYLFLFFLMNIVAVKDAGLSKTSFPKSSHRPRTSQQKLSNSTTPTPSGRTCSEPVLSAEAHLQQAHSLAAVQGNR